MFRSSLLALLLVAALNVQADDRHDILKSPPPPNLPELGYSGGFKNDWMTVVPSECIKKRDTSELCKQQWKNRIEIKEAKKLMPELPGLKPERITVRRNGIIFNYSW